MQSSDKVPWHIESIDCYGCKKEMTVVAMDARAYKAPHGWFAIDTFPPGDGGIYWACSEKCVEIYYKKELANEI